MKGSKFWHIYYYCNGRQIRETSKSESKMAAERLLHRRFAEMGVRAQPGQASEKIKYDEIRQSLLDDYRISGHRSLITLADGTETVSGLNHLDDFLRGRLVTKITTDVLRAFIRNRKQPYRYSYPVRNSTINRNLALLRRMMNLAQRDGKIQFIPRFPVLEEKAPRKGFLEREEFKRLKDELPERLRPIVIFLYTIGLPIGEVKGIRWQQIDLDALEIRLESDQQIHNRPRIVPLDGLAELFAELRRERGTREHRFEPVFCAKNLRKAWRRACIRLGLGRIESLPNEREIYRGLLVQDLRRSAIRNMIDAGVAEKVAMEISGYKVREVFDPYNDVSTERLHEAMQRVQAKADLTSKEN
ncbi:MAG: tyrosine-type recombinase/integrase [Candidatus Acidiferrales bacterium]